MKAIWGRIHLKLNLTRQTIKRKIFDLERRCAGSRQCSTCVSTNVRRRRKWRKGEKKKQCKSMWATSTQNFFIVSFLTAGWTQVGLSNRTRLASANTLAPLLPLCPRRHCLFRPRSTPHSRPGQLGWLGPTYSQLDVAGFQRWNEKLSMLSMPHTFWRLPACVCFKASLLLCNLIPWLKSYTLGTISLFFCWLSVGNETCWPLYLFSLQLFVEHSFSMMSDDL